MKEFFNKIIGFFIRSEKKATKDLTAAGGKITDKVLKTLEYEETLLARIGYRALCYLVMPLIKAVWIHRVDGLENIPRSGGCIIAANHESYFDFLCFTSICPRKIHYLAAEKFFQSRLWRPIMKMTGQIKVDRHSKDKEEAYGQVISALKQHRVVGIFPEGTRSADGELNKAFTGVAKFALKAKVPIVPVGIIGTFDIMSRHDKYPKFKRARILIGEPMYFEHHYGKDDDKAIHREITDKVMHTIAKMIGKEYRHDEAESAK
jgi:1-acyl-sn-glycerol-3-phosphate acyltransferase